MAVTVLDRYVEVKVQIKLKEGYWTGLLFGLPCMVRGGEDLIVGQKAGVKVVAVGDSLRGEYVGKGGQPIWADVEKQVGKYIRRVK